MQLASNFGARVGELDVIHNGVAPLPESEYGRGEVRRAARRSVLDELALPSNAVLVLTVARLDEQKGHADLVRAIPRILAAFPETRFLWAGNGPSEGPLSDSLQRGGLQQHVHMLGHRMDVRRLLDASRGSYAVFKNQSETRTMISNMRDSLCRTMIQTKAGKKSDNGIFGSSS